VQTKWLPVTAGEGAPGRAGISGLAISDVDACGRQVLDTY
jgi:hypothetical protein